MRAIVNSPTVSDFAVDFLSSEYFKYIDVRDFLSRLYDIGGVVSVVAVSSLFILMTEHGLEYPTFMENLSGHFDTSLDIQPLESAMISVGN
ncbi:hypothetical protein MLD38_022783 [Melastoma candidum]|uniref:Uncharacterized protein n=1 Tax=Melastoma candidum TaxID=119954 RepID=A0ACB9QNU9_9MYRT|nr:hypothetical protein MLD38_022783 [Melastoma candidum]